MAGSIDNSLWIIDGGSTTHLTNDITCMHNIKYEVSESKVASKSTKFVMHGSTDFR